MRENSEFFPLALAGLILQLIAFILFLVSWTTAAEVLFILSLAYFVTLYIAPNLLLHLSLLTLKWPRERLRTNASVYPELGSSEITGSSFTPEQEAAMLNDLKSRGRLNLHYDRKMMHGRLSRVEASIFKDVSKAIQKAFTESYELKIAPVMRVDLAGENFEIKSIGKNEEQFVLSDSPTTWKWDVKPLKAGKQTLEVTASVAFVFEKYGQKYRNLETLKEEIKVRVNLPLAVKNVIIENWKWIVAISTLTGLVLNYLNYTGFFSK